MFWDLIQHNQIENATAQAMRAENVAQRSADEARRTLEKLELKIESLTLTCRALFEFLQDKEVITEKQLAEKMREIDLRDGKADGRLASKPLTCTDCNRTSSAKAANRSKCLYCGGTCA